MNLLLLTLLLALMWAAVTGTFTLINLLFGAAIGVLALTLLRDQVARPRALRQLRRAVRLCVVFVWELLVSAIRVAMIVLHPNLRKKLRPAIVAVPLSVKSDSEITLLANLITLTPGTLSVDVSDDRSQLLVHVLELGEKDTLIRDIKSGFERRVAEVFDDGHH